MRFAMGMETSKGEEAPRCYRHGKVAAEAICQRCSNPTCAACTEHASEGALCPPCASTARRRARSRRAALIAGGVGGAAALFLFLLLTRPERDATPPAATDESAASFDYGRHDAMVRLLRGRLDADPCDRATAIELGDLLNLAGDHRGASALTHAYLDACGDTPRLLWVAVYAHQELEEWEEVARLCTLLIEDRPTDSDFWWWRGEAYQMLGRVDEATADYLQSMANRPNGFAAWRHTELLGESDRACESAFALAYYVDHRHDQNTERAARYRAQLWRDRECDRVAGSGRAVIPRERDAPVMRTRARLDGVEATAAVGPDTGLVTVTRAFAEAMGLAVADGPIITVYVAGEMIPARPATLGAVEIGGARAEGVTAAVVDALPDDLDAVLGVSFLWRFALTRDEEALTLAPIDFTNDAPPAK